MQAQSTHKVGTDGVLLGAWTRVEEEDGYVLDIGTGSGLIALMMAQRTGKATRIDAVEIDTRDAQMAQENVNHSPWPEKVTIHNLPVQQFFPAKKYDLIVSNPPYFVKSLRPPEEKRSQARHTHALSFEALLQAAHRLLAPTARLGVILPFSEGLQFLSLAEEVGLFPLRRTNFRARAHKPVKRLLLELAYGKRPLEERELILYREAENWSEDYRTLTTDFYLTDKAKGWETPNSLRND